VIKEHADDCCNIKPHFAQNHCCACCFLFIHLSSQFCNPLNVVNYWFNFFKRLLLHLLFQFWLSKKWTGHL
jgi:hypothetical protein